MRRAVFSLFGLMAEDLTSKSMIAWCCHRKYDPCFAYNRSPAFRSFYGLSWVGESLSAYSALPTVLVHGDSSFNLPSSVPSGLTQQAQASELVEGAKWLGFQFFSLRASIFG